MSKNFQKSLLRSHLTENLVRSESFPLLNDSEVYIPPCRQL